MELDSVTVLQSIAIGLGVSFVAGVLVLNAGMGEREQEIGQEGHGETDGVKIAQPVQ